MSLAKSCVPLVQAVRRIGTTEIRKSQPSAVSLKIKNKQEKFQVADGQPVHLKGGFGDKLMFQGTMALCVIGLGFCFKLYADLSFPKKA